MIGVQVSDAFRPVVREFFQLFKTPWEFILPGRRYDVQIATPSCDDFSRAGLTIVYHGGIDSQSRTALSTGTACELEFQTQVIPIYCGITNFPAEQATLLRDRKTAAAALYANRFENRTIVHVGYSLFSEVEFLLSKGQPVRYASAPTLEYHIAILRELILRAEIAVVEIPPKPAGYAFTACLTHDIDHPLQSRHLLDYTMAGFLFRASIGSVFNTLRRRIPFSKLIENLTAVLQIPLLFVGLARDRWSQFDKYLGVESGLGATYFVIPRAKYPGKRQNGSAPARRASGYGAMDIRSQMQRILASGCEIGTHGLDAWIDIGAGQRERDIVAQTAGTDASGIRMHWLYFDAQSPKILESAGFSYDSTVGYNQTVGFRAGTVQAFAPLGARTLIELPLHVMDTALFYPSYLNLTDAAAFSLVKNLICFAAKHSGVLTFNWHDRSLFPERLWGDVYQKIITELKQQNAWFPTASDAVRWFRMRRDAQFTSETVDGGLEIRGSYSSPADLPSLVLHITTPPPRLSGEALAHAPLSDPKEYSFPTRCSIRVKS